MDNGRGQFEQITAEEAAKQLKFIRSGDSRIFHVGEQLRVKKSLFEVEEITSTKMVLKLLPNPFPLKPFGKGIKRKRRKRLNPGKK